MKWDEKHLTKNHDQHGGLSHCHCPPGMYQALSRQAGCPECGCGWMWICSHCRAGFTVAMDNDGNKFLHYNREAIPFTEDADHLTEEGRLMLRDPEQYK